MRVGALDGRHPTAGELVLKRIAAALTPKGQLFIDGGNPLRDIGLPRSHDRHRLTDHCQDSARHFRDAFTRF